VIKRLSDKSNLHQEKPVLLRFLGTGKLRKEKDRQWLLGTMKGEVIRDHARPGRRRSGETTGEGEGEKLMHLRWFLSTGGGGERDGIDGIGESIQVMPPCTWSSEGQNCLGMEASLTLRVQTFL